MTKHNSTMEERLLANMRKDPDGCWRWTGAIADVGYGNIGVKGVNGKVTRVHIVAYETWVGPIPDGMDIGHKCHDEAAALGLCTSWESCPHRTCIRPDHLKPEPRRDNLLASPLTQASINASKTECKRGHEFTEENTGRKKSTNWRYCRACQRMGKEGRAAWDAEHG